MRHTIAVIKTAAGSSLIRYESIPTFWHAFLADQPYLGYCGANGTNLQWRGVLDLRTQLGYFVATVSLGVSSFLYIKQILGTP